MKNKISQTIMESLEEYTDFHADVHSGTKCPFGKIKSHLLQSQIKLIEAVIEDLGKRKWMDKDFVADDYYRGYNKALKDQISSLNQVKEEIKNILK